MSRPLYQEAAQGVTLQNGHAGLWYDKFCDRWKDDFSGLGDEGKKEWVKSVTTQRVGNKDQLAQHQTRLTKLLAAYGQELLPYTLESPFVTGLGRAHPVENGFAWHHTLGTPYLPGSSVKGMVRAWAEIWEAAKLEDIRRIFGPSADDLKNHRDLKANIGSIVFLDAVPERPTALKADVMTPHYGPWYRGEAPPADWHSPIPVPFLVVEKGATFLFGVLPRRDDERSKRDCETVKSWLEQALRWLGAGAKTAVGYGRFALDEETQQQVEEERRKRQTEREAQEAAQRRAQELERQTAGKSELYREFYMQSSTENWREDKNAFSQAGLIEEWLTRLEADPQPDALALLADLVRAHFPGLLDDPDAMGGKRNDKPVFKDRQRTFGKRLLALLARG